MKQILLSLLFLPVFAFGQKFPYLDYVQKNDSVKTGQAIMYGNFVQRLGFSSGGFPQEMTVRHVETGTVYIFRVKSTFKSKKEDFFCVHLPPGRYTVENYYWTQSKWYGATAHREPVFKNTESRQLGKMEAEGTVNEENLEQYEFTLQPDVVTYVGTWNFEQDAVRFFDEKPRLDEKVKKIFKKLAFDNVGVAIPQ